MGGITAPLLAEPFLVQRGNTVSILGLSLENSSMRDPNHNSLSIQASRTFDPFPQHNSSARTETIVPAQSLQLLFHKDTTNMTSRCDKSYVHFVYIIEAVLFLPASLGFMVQLILGKEGHTSITIATGYNELDQPQTSARCTFVIFLILLTITFNSFGGLPYAYTAYLTSYGVNGSLHVDVQRMASMTSAFWLLFLLGRILGTALSSYLKQSTLIYICILGTLLSAICVAVTGPMNDTYLWVGSMPLAIFTAPLLAASLSWCRTCIPLTPLVLGVCTIGDASGAAVMPYITGQVIGHFGLEWFMKCIVVEAAFQAATFVVLTLLSKL